MVALHSSRLDNTGIACIVRRRLWCIGCKFNEPLRDMTGAAPLTPFEEVKLREGNELVGAVTSLKANGDTYPDGWEAHANSLFVRNNGSVEDHY